VLGAGFTRAFLPRAPLLVDDYNTAGLKAECGHLPFVCRLLDLEQGRTGGGGRIDIERLMTRLEGRMPYDVEQGAGDEGNLLLAAVKRSFQSRLEDARTTPQHQTLLSEFARYCVKRRMSCITFNYDDIFDQALWEVEKVKHIMAPNAYWHPDGGYGFFCRPSTMSISASGATMDRTAMLLLKLHGSVNWRVRRGYPMPYSVDALVHHESWSPLRDEGLPFDVIERHLEREPFIVPPVLVKSALVEQPVLRLVWSLAYQALSQADQVVFVGYSLPVTDIAAGFLFGEAIRPDTRVNVVNLHVNGDASGDERRALCTRYGAIFPWLTNSEFAFDGAVAWVRRLLDDSKKAGPTDTGRPANTSA